MLEIFSTRHYYWALYWRPRFILRRAFFSISAAALIEKLRRAGFLL